MRNEEILSRARCQCAELEGSDAWNDAVEEAIVRLSSSEEQAGVCIEQLNLQLFSSCGVV